MRTAHAESGARVVTANFDSFYAATYPEIARALSVTLGDAGWGQEAADEAMTRAFDKWADVSTYSNPAGWVYRVGLNWSLSWKRRRRRERDRPIEFGPRHETMVARDDSFDDALRQLSIEHRAVVVCRVHLDWSVGQTADALAIEPGTVKSRLSRALAKLRNAIEDEGGGDDR